MTTSRMILMAGLAALCLAGPVGAQANADPLPSTPETLIMRQTETWEDRGTPVSSIETGLESSIASEIQRGNFWAGFVAGGIAAAVGYSLWANHRHPNARYANLGAWFVAAPVGAVVGGALFWTLGVGHD